MIIEKQDNSSTYFDGNKKNNESDNFNELVLEHIKNNRPSDSLGDLLTDMGNLSPDKPVTMTQLSSALLYSNATLRNDPDYMDYTTETLDNRTNQLLGLSMTMTNLISYYQSRHNDDDLI